VHHGTSAGHRDVKLCFIRLAKRPNRHADNNLVDRLGLACVTRDSHSLVDMQSGAIANDLAFVEYDLALFNSDYGAQLVIQELLPAVFDVFRKPDPVADRERNFFPHEHAELARLVEWQLLFDAILSDDDSSLLSAKDLPLFSASKALFFDSTANSPFGYSVKLDDLSWLISDRILLLGLSQVEPL